MYINYLGFKIFLFILGTKAKDVWRSLRDISGIKKQLEGKLVQARNIQITHGVCRCHFWTARSS